MMRSWTTHGIIAAGSGYQTLPASETACLLVRGFFMNKPVSELVCEFVAAMPPVQPA